MKLNKYLIVALLTMAASCRHDERKIPPSLENPQQNNDGIDKDKPKDPNDPNDPNDSNDPNDTNDGNKEPLPTPVVDPDNPNGIDALIDRLQVPGKDSIVHMFNYTFEEIEASLPQIASAGFGAIQISPPQLSNGGPWWGRYQPLDYRIIDGPLGNETQLRNMVAAADALGIDVIADVVLNHMANMGSNFDLSYPPQEFRSKYKIGGLFSRNDFKSPYCISNWNDPQHVIDGRLCGGDGDSGLPDLVLMSDYVIGVHQTYLRKLKDIGIKGFRVDAVKHMEKEYFPRVFTDEITEGVFVFGEVIATAGTFDRDLEPYLRATDMAFMDFPLQATIKDAFGPSGSLSNLIGAVNRKGALSWDRAVTFVVNHDIPNNEGFRSQILDPIDETLAYTYILGRSYGVPHIYSAKGKADGLRDDRWKFAHLDSSLKRKNFFHNVVHGTGQTVIHSSNCALVISRGDKAFFTINKCGEDLDLSQNLGLNAGTYRELLADQTIEMSSGEQKLTIPARSSQMFLHTDLLK